MKYLAGNEFVQQRNAFDQKYSKGIQLKGKCRLPRAGCQMLNRNGIKKNDGMYFTHFDFLETLQSVAFLSNYR
jgi:hypothetical protein